MKCAFYRASAHWASLRELLVRIVVYYYTVFAKPSCGGWQAFRKVIYMALSALLELSEKEYDAFASVHPYANFLNSIYSGRKFALRGWDVHYVGIRRDGEIAAATLLVSGYNSPRAFSSRSSWISVLKIMSLERFSVFSVM